MKYFGPKAKFHLFQRDRDRDGDGDGDGGASDKHITKNCGLLTQSRSSLTN